jgi:56kDa selenium binding protein (SBP56)
VMVSSEFGEPNAYEPGFEMDDVSAGRYGQRLHFWDLAERRLVQTLDLGEAGLVPLEVRWLHDPDADQGFAGATLASNILRFSSRERGVQRGAGDRRRERGVRGLAATGRSARPHHRHRALDGRPLPLPLQLAARRPSPVRRFGPRGPAAHGPALAWRAAREAERCGARAGRRAPDDPAVAGRAEALRHQLALMQAGRDRARRRAASRC